MANAGTIAYVIYFVHLASVFYIIAYLPYSKLAHLVYRTVAMGYAAHIDRPFGVEVAEAAPVAAPAAEPTPSAEEAPAEEPAAEETAVEKAAAEAEPAEEKTEAPTAEEEEEKKE